MKRVFAVLVGVCILASLAGSEEPSDVFGKFLNAKGTVEIMKKGAQERVPIKRGDLIHYGDKVWTREDSRATIITATRKVVNLEANTELDTAGQEPSGWLARSLGMEGLFQKGLAADALIAVAGVRAELEYVLSPRNSAIKTTTPVIQFRKLPEKHTYRIKITGGGIPAPYTGTIDKNILDLCKADLRNPLERESTYFIQVELLDERGGLRGKERDVFMRPLGDEDLAKITEIEKELARLEKNDASNPSYKLLLASEYEDIGLYSDALAIYEDLCEQQPADEFIRLQLAHMYNQTKLITELRKLTAPEE